ncbi:hypothetical protein [Roseimaritima multifibrata]|nr:hypothetical protein [Roseimaritima multifibrata]
MTNHSRISDIFFRLMPTLPSESGTQVNLSTKQSHAQIDFVT